MSIRWTISAADPLAAAMDVLVVPVWSDKKIAVKLPALVTREVQARMKARQWSGAWGTAALFVQPVKNSFPLVALVGLGEQRGSLDRVREGMRRGIGTVVADARRHGLANMGIVVAGVPSASDVAMAAVESVTMANYSFVELSSSLTARAGRQNIKSGIVFVDKSALSATKKALPATTAVLDGVTLARTLVNRPAGHMSPKSLVEEARRIVRRRPGNLSLTVFNRAAARKKGFTAFLAVAQGSNEEPYVIHLRYRPVRMRRAKRIFLVGKGVTFDSGGLSLKPADYMETMKADMAGAATVLGVFSVLAELRPNIEVHGVICACENMPSGTAYRPGDVISAKNGKTIEVLNTDAEGRITLADALAYAVEHRPAAIIDFATLTGASMVGLGETVAGLWGTDEQLLADLQAAAQSSGEGVAALPMPEEYKPMLESRVADLKNITSSKFGGAITAAMFLREFVGDVPWAHFDFAGPSYFTRSYLSYWGVGGSGYGVRTLVNYVNNS